jgi:hypothetical protein
MNMDKTKFSKIPLIKAILWGIILVSFLALIYHIRWLFPFLTDSFAHRVPTGQSPLVWFCVQILSNILFVFVGFLLIRLFNRYQINGFFDRQSLKVFDAVIISCVILAFLGLVKLAFSEFLPLPLSHYKSFWGAINLFTFLIIDTITFREPQSMYLLMSSILWVVKQFVIKAISIKSENEAFI